MRLFLIVMMAGVLSTFAPLARAQDDEGLARRQALAERYVDLAVGDNLRKAFEEYTDAITKSGGAEFAEERAWMRENLPDMVIQMIDELLTDMTPIYAETLTEAELTALVNFYDTPLGREIARKNVQLSIQTEPMMREATEAYTERMMSQFCARFECDEDGEPKMLD